VKTLRRISATIVLSLTFAMSVFAGHIETPGAPAPAPKSTIESPLAGETETTETLDPTLSSTSTTDSTVIFFTILGLIYP